MSFAVPLVMFGWIPIVLGLFGLLSPRRAVIAAFLFAWLFLPMASYNVPGITAYTKMTATCAGVLLGTAIFDAERLLAFRPAWFDLPMLIWCLCPFASSLSNDLGAYDGCSTAVYQSITWGLPYLAGRLYFSDPDALRELAIGIFIGGLVYMPLCLFEIRMSPQLHRIVYGFYQHDFAQTIRYGGWRPTVFMQHGLMVGMWMTAASLLGTWLWIIGILRQRRSALVASLLLALLVTTVFCKSSGALILLLVGLAGLLVMKWTGSSSVLWCLILVAPLYMGLRITGMWSGQSLVSLSAQWIDPTRGESLQFRMDNEDQLMAKAMEQPVLGWGKWGRSHIYNDAGRDVSVTDGLWIIALGDHGLVGLTSLTMTLLLPVIRLLATTRAAVLRSTKAGPAVGIAMLLMLYMIDCIPNGMVNPIFMLAGGGLAGIAAWQIGCTASPRPAPAYCPARRCALQYGRR